MTQISSRQASLYAIIIFILTIIGSYFLQSLAIAISGMLVVIQLSVFVEDVKSTIRASVASIIIIVAVYFTYKSDLPISQILAELFFVLLLVFFTTTIVFYAKNLYRQIKFDKIQLSSIFGNVTEGIILTNSKNEMIMVNPAAEKMFGYKAEELIGKSVDILTPEHYRGKHYKLREGYNKNPENREMGQGRDLSAVRKNGTEFPVEISLSHYNQNNDSYVIAFIVDITQRKKIEDNLIRQKKELENVTNEIRNLNAELEIKVEERTQILQEALQRLEKSQIELSAALNKERQLSEIKSRFVSMASHEFRTPLSTVYSSATLLSKYVTTEEQEKRNKHVIRIKDSVMHLNEILEDFLSLGKLDEGKVSVQWVDFDLKELLTETTDDVRGLLKNDQQIFCKFEGDNIINSDKNLLKNIIINLLTNAIKFSEDDKPIRIISKSKDGWAEISVTDEGIGISEDDQMNLFDSFFRGGNALNIQGSGLGLHIVKRYINLLEGKVILQSQLNKGTTVTVKFPVNHR